MVQIEDTLGLYSKCARVHDASRTTCFMSTLSGFSAIRIR